MRTIISCIDEHNFILLTVTRDSSSALTMRQCVDYLQSAFDPLWTYNLDGGPSIALYYRLSPDETGFALRAAQARMRTLWRSRTKNLIHNLRTQGGFPMANVLLLNGSPHAHGAIDLALTKVAQTLQECGLTTEIVHIGQQDIRGCIACGRCGVLHRCAFDDAVNALARSSRRRMR